MFVDFLEDVEVLGLGVSDVDDDFFQVFVVYYCVVKEFSEFVVFLVRNFLQRIEESASELRSHYRRRGKYVAVDATKTPPEISKFLERVMLKNGL